MAGILCLHRITDNRLTDRPPENLLNELGIAAFAFESGCENGTLLQYTRNSSENHRTIALFCLTTNRNLLYVLLISNRRHYYTTDSANTVLSVWFAMMRSFMKMPIMHSLFDFRKLQSTGMRCKFCSFAAQAAVKTRPHWQTPQKNSRHMQVCNCSYYALLLY